MPLRWDWLLIALPCVYNFVTNVPLRWDCLLTELPRVHNFVIEKKLLFALDFATNSVSSRDLALFLSIRVYLRLVLAINSTTARTFTLSI